MKKFFMFGCLLCFAIAAWAQDSELISKAQSGDAEAQYELAENYEYGSNGFEVNKTEATTWYLKAAEWYLKAAEQGNAKAQYKIGYCYNFGKGVPIDDAKAEHWLLKSAAQGYERAYFSLGLFYEDTNKEEAIYWFKKYMDYWYEKYGKEHELSAEELRKLGVYYHPDSKSSGVSTASRSSSSGSGSSRSSSSASCSADGLLYEGTYRQSPQGYNPETGLYTDAIGPGFVLSVKIYDSYIIVDGTRCAYVNTSSGWKIYKGNNMFGTTQYYKVNPDNFEMSSYTYGINPYTGSGSTLVYGMKKGEVLFDIHQNNTNTYGSGYSGGGNSTSRSSGSERSRSTYRKDCHLCHGSGKCNTCNGTHRYLNPLTNKYVTCPNCRTDGRCSACNGTGKEQ